MCTEGDGVGAATCMPLHNVPCVTVLNSQGLSTHWECDFCHDDPCLNGGGCSNGDAFSTTFECSWFVFSIQLCLSHHHDKFGNCSLISRCSVSTELYSYAGSDCSEIIVCIEGRCANNGTCEEDENEEDGYRCDCTGSCVHVCTNS